MSTAFDFAASFYARELQLPPLLDPEQQQAILSEPEAFLRRVGSEQCALIRSIIQRESHLVEGGFAV